MVFYLKGFLYSLGSVAGLYVAIRYGLQTKVGLTVYFLGYWILHGFDKPLQATAGGNPSLLGHLWFWLWSMILFAGTFLVYLRVKSTN